LILGIAYLHLGGLAAFDGKLFARIIKSGSEAAHRNAVN
jgi:hypothetical protein